MLANIAARLVGDPPNVTTYRVGAAAPADDVDEVGPDVEDEPVGYRPPTPPVLTPRQERRRDKIAALYVPSSRSIDRLVSSIRGSASAAFRSSNPILGYAGHNGSGKTLAMCFDAHHVMEHEGRPQLSTVPLFDFRLPAEYAEVVNEQTGKVRRVQTGPLHPLYVPLVDWVQLIEARDCDVLLDEVQGVASSRGMNSLPPQLLSKFLQLRKADCRLRWTTTNWTRVDKSLREVTYALALCTSQRPDRHARQGPWTPRLRFKVRTIDSTSLDSVETINPEHGLDENGERLQTYDVERRRRRRDEPALYSTFDSATVMNHVSEGGWCVTCGGTKVRPRCSCGGKH